MAFYTVRIDEHGEEIESTRRTGYDTGNRSNCTNYTNTTVIDNSKNCETRQSTIRSTYKTVRYINSAIFIEKDSNEIQENCTGEQMFEDNDEISSNCHKPHITESIPLLGLNSNEFSFSESCENLTYSYNNACDSKKIIIKPSDAYNEWLAAKRLEKSYEQQKKIQQIEHEKRLKEQRKMLAEEKFHKWLEQKKQTQLKQSNNKNTNEINKALQENNNCNEINSDSKKKSFENWLKNKLQQKKLKEEELNKRAKLLHDLEKERQKNASKAYEQWARVAPYKPKPVPLNQGLFTLKGCISEPFVNPNPWVSIIEEKE